MLMNFTITHAATDLKQQNKFVFTKYYIAHSKVKNMLLQSPTNIKMHKLEHLLMLKRELI